MGEILQEGDYTFDDDAPVILDDGDYTFDDSGVDEAIDVRDVLTEKGNTIAVPADYNDQDIGVLADKEDNPDGLWHSFEGFKFGNLMKFGGVQFSDMGGSLNLQVANEVLRGKEAGDSSKLAQFAMAASSDAKPEDGFIDNYLALLGKPFRIASALGVVASKKEDAEALRDSALNSFNRNEKYLIDNNIVPKEGTGGRFLFDALSSGLPMAGGMVAVLVTRNPAAASLFFGTLQETSVYKEGIDAGLSHRDSLTKAMAAGGLEAAVEAVGGKFFLGVGEDVGSFVARRIAKRMGGEFLQETTQQAGEEIVTSDIRDTTVEEKIGNVAYAGAIALFMSGSISISAEIVNKVRKKAGISQEQADFINEQIAEEKQTIANALQDAIESNDGHVSKEANLDNMKLAAQIIDDIDQNGFINLDDYEALGEHRKFLDSEIAKAGKKNVIAEKRLAVIKERDRVLQGEVKDIADKAGVDVKDIPHLVAIGDIFNDRTRAKGKNLLSFIASNKGINDGSQDEAGVAQNYKGELSYAKELNSRVVNNKSGLDIEAMIELAYDNGYFYDYSEMPTVVQFLSEVRRGDSRFSEEVAHDIALEDEIINNAEIELDTLYEGTIAGSEASTISAEYGKLKKRIKDIRDNKVKYQDTIAILKQESSNLKKERARIPTLESLEKKSIEEAQNMVINRIKESGLSLNDKGKFLTTVRDAANHKAILKTLEKVTGRIEKLKERSLIRDYKRVIKTIQRVTKTRGIKPKGKYVADVQTEFDGLRELLDKDDKAASAILDGDNVLEQYNAMEILALRHAAGQNNLDGYKRLAEYLVDLKDYGVKARQSKDMEDFLRIREYIDTTIDVVTGGGTGKVYDDNKLISILKAYPTRLAGALSFSWDSILDALSTNDKTSASENSNLSKIMDVSENTRAKSKGVYESVFKLYGIIGDAYGLDSQRKINRKIAKDNRKETVATTKDANGDVQAYIMTRQQARKLWAEWKAPELHKILLAKEGNAYTEEFFRILEDEYLTVQDKEVATGLFEFYEEIHGRVNDVYRRINGADLNKRNNYTPIPRDAELVAGNVNLLDSMYGRVSSSPNNFKQRTDNMIKLDLASDIDVAHKYMRRMEHYIAWAEKVQDMNAVFGNAAVRSKIKSHFPTIIPIVDDFIADFASDGKHYNGLVERSIETLRRNFVVSVLGLKLNLAIKQQVSIFTAWETMPTHLFLKYMYEGYRNPVKSFKMLEDSIMLKTRGKDFMPELNSLSNDRTIASAQDGIIDKITIPKKLTSAVMSPIRIGDKAAVVVVGQAIYKYARKQGKTHEQAIKEFEKFSSRTQQSTNTAELSYMQRAKFLKWMTMFLSSPIQYFNREMAAIRGLISGRKNPIEVGKALFIYHFVLPMIFQFVSDGFEWDEDSQKKAAALGSLNGFLLAGSAIDEIISAMLDSKQYSDTPSLLKAKREIGQGIREINDGDVFRALEVLSEASGKISGAPSKQVMNMYGGFNKIKEGKVLRGAANIAGWSDYSLDK